MRSLQAFYPNLKKRLVKSPKVFVRDSGILLQLLSIYKYEDLMSHPVLGAAWEGFVIDQIVSLFGDEFEFAYYRTHEGAECDLILLESDLPKIAIEIKFTSTPKLTKGMMQAFDDLNATKNYIITPYSDTYRIHERVEVTSLSSFLQTQARAFELIN